MASKDHEYDSLTGDSTVNGEVNGQTAILLSPTGVGLSSGKTEDRLNNSVIRRNLK